MRGSPTMACSSIIRTLVAIGSARQPKPIWKSTICEYEPFSFIALFQLRLLLWCIDILRVQILFIFCSPYVDL